MRCLEGERRKKGGRKEGEREVEGGREMMDGRYTHAHTHIELTSIDTERN